MSKNESHLMIDIETLGVSAAAPILSIGAVIFDIENGKQGKTFYTRISWESAIRGRLIDPSTIKWWMTQEHNAKHEILYPKKEQSLKEALLSLNEWLLKLSVDVEKMYVWSNGPAFDIAILDHAYRQNGIVPEWSFWNIRDCRTIALLASKLAEFDIKTIEFKGDQHNALHDAQHQAQYVSACWKALETNDSDMFE